MLQQHDGLAIDNLAGANHLQRLIQRQFQHFDLLAFIFKSAGIAGFQAVIGDKEKSFCVTEPELMRASNTFSTC